MFGERLRQLRDYLKYSQEQFAEELGVTSQQISTWETSTHAPRITVITKIAQTFQVSTDYLLGIKSELKGDIHASDLSPVEQELVSAFRRKDTGEALLIFSSVLPDSARRLQEIIANEENSDDV